MSNKTFDTLKWVALTGIPPLATFVGVVGSLVSWEHTTAATTIIVAFGTLLGGWLGISHIQYNKGENNG